MGWSRRAASLISAAPEQKQEILEEWEKEVMGMDDLERSDIKIRIENAAESFERLLNKFDTDENFRQKLLARNPQQREFLENQIQIYRSLKAPFETLP